MVVEVANPANVSIHSGDVPPVKTVLTPPDALPNRVLYTNAGANKSYNDTQYDIYMTQKEHDRLVKKPKSIKSVLKVLALVFAGAGLIYYRKNVLEYCKNGYSKMKNLFIKSNS